MRLAFLPGTVLLGLCVLALPAQDSEKTSPYEKILKEFIVSLDSLTGVLGAVKDEESAKAAVPEVKKLAARLGELSKKGKALRMPDKAEKERITKLYREKLETAVKKEIAEIARVKAIPGGSELVQLVKPPEEKTKKQSPNRTTSDIPSELSRVRYESATGVGDANLVGLCCPRKLDRLCLWLRRQPARHGPRCSNPSQ
jgi:hypothetical protein